MPSRDEYCPVAKSVEVLGDRWSLLIVRELLRGVHGFNELERSLPGISRSLLAARLRRLERDGVVGRSVAGPRRAEYRLTERGRELRAAVKVLNDWGVRWFVPTPRTSEIDPDGLMLWIRRHAALDALPPSRVVIAVDLIGREHRRYWLVLRPGEVSLCPDHPGFEEDIRLTGRAADFYDLFLGRVTLADAISRGTLEIDGPPPMVRMLPRWFRLRPGRSTRLAPTSTGG